jgi:hypothetical protein
MKMIEDQTRIGSRDCITFKEQMKHKKLYRNKRSACGCHSWIGKLKTERPQILSLYKTANCVDQSIIIHE